MKTISVSRVWSLLWVSALFLGIFYIGAVAVRGATATVLSEETKYFPENASPQAGSMVFLGSPNPWSVLITYRIEYMSDGTNRVFFYSSGSGGNVYAQLYSSSPPASDAGTGAPPSGWGIVKNHQRLVGDTSNYGSLTDVAQAVVFGSDTALLLHIAGVTNADTGTVNYWSLVVPHSVGAVARKALPWSITNPKNYDVQVEILNTANEVIQSVLVPALQTISRDTLANVLTWEAASSASVGVRLRLPANFVSGSWVSADLATGDTVAIGVFNGLAYSPPGETAPLEPIQALSWPPGTPENGTLPPSSQPVWTAGGDESPLENGVYKEGVEKQLAELSEIKELLSGDGMIEEPGTAAFPAVAGEGDQFSGKLSAGELMTKLGNLLPAAPDHIFPSSVTKSSKYALTFPMNAVTRGAIADVEFDLDVEPFDTGVQFCRGVALAVLNVLTYLIVVETVRRIFV